MVPRKSPPERRRDIWPERTSYKATRSSHYRGVHTGCVAGGEGAFGYEGQIPRRSGDRWATVEVLQIEPRRFESIRMPYRITSRRSTSRATSSISTPHS